MTPEEFAPIAALIDNSCKDDFDEARELAYGEVLARYDAGDVRAAVVDLLGVGRGSAWAPSTDEIAQAIAKVRRVGTPDWIFEQLTVLVAGLVRYSPEGQDALCTRKLRGEHIAEQIAAIHPDFGPALAEVVATIPLYVVIQRQNGWWDCDGALRYVRTVRAQLPGYSPAQLPMQ